jgi:hypothetical protein
MLVVAWFSGVRELVNIGIGVWALPTAPSAQVPSHLTQTLDLNF